MKVPHSSSTLPLRRAVTASPQFTADSYPVSAPSPCVTCTASHESAISPSSSAATPWAAPSHRYPRSASCTCLTETKCRKRASRCRSAWSETESGQHVGLEVKSGRRRNGAWGCRNAGSYLGKGSIKCTRYLLPARRSGMPRLRGTCRARGLTSTFGTTCYLVSGVGTVQRGK